MLTLRQSPFDLLERLEQQVAQAERVPAAEVLEDANGYTVRLELPGVDHGSIDVKATDRTLVISAERRPTPTSDASDTSGDTNAVDTTPAQQLFSEFRPGTWSRSFRFAQGLNREAITANYRDGVLEITAGKTQSHTSVTVAVDA